MECCGSTVSYDWRLVLPRLCTAPGLCGSCLLAIPTLGFSVTLLCIPVSWVGWTAVGGVATTAVALVALGIKCTLPTPPSGEDDESVSVGGSVAVTDIEAG